MSGRSVWLRICGGEGADNWDESMRMSESGGNDVTNQKERSLDRQQRSGGDQC